ncbi:hypothetical protein K9M47_04495 [Candidatus Gracilibacteria bacterium]|nr:hypothetical protein [Candidatus Gracilibacteria bacterium]MCF7898832.1 hypothetical protein [Candidatus Paceibacterota bacterium]
MRNVTAFIIATIIIVGTGYIVTKDTGGGKFESNKKVESIGNVENSKIEDSIQYVTITARGGYSPRQSFAKAGIPTKIIMKTNGTYDCSLALAIRSINYREMLPNTGETIIDIGTPKTGDVIQGVCSMGMYNFAVEFR